MEGEQLQGPGTKLGLEIRRRKFGAQSVKNGWVCSANKKVYELLFNIQVLSFSGLRIALNYTSQIGIILFSIDKYTRECWGLE